jgi:1-acyl-sn-glycerol-3-phosphate acyltransferase
MSDARSEDPSNAFPPTSGLVYTCFLTVWKVILNIFFREIRPRGTFNIPREGPVILVVAPHANQVRVLASLHGLSDLIVDIAVFGSAAGSHPSACANGQAHALHRRRR